MASGWGEGWADVPADRPEIRVISPDGITLVKGDYRGDWAANRLYFAGDFIKEPGTGVLMFTAVEHKSGEEYDSSVWNAMFDPAGLLNFTTALIVARRNYLPSGLTGNFEFSYTDTNPIITFRFVLGGSTATMMTAQPGVSDGQRITLYNDRSSGANLVIDEDNPTVDIADDVIMVPGAATELVWNAEAQKYQVVIAAATGGGDASLPGRVTVLEGIAARAYATDPIDTITAATGVVLPVVGTVHRLATAGGVVTVSNVSLTNIPDRTLIWLGGPAVGGQDVTLVHDAGGVGEMLFNGGANLTLAGLYHWVVMERNGSSLREVARFGFATGLTNPMTVALDLGRNAILNQKLGVKTVATATYTPNLANDDESDNGQILDFTHAAGCVVTLPAESVIGLGFGWIQSTPDLKFVAASGAELVHPLNHLRGLGIGAMGACVLRATGAPVKWVLGGATKAASGAALERDAVWSFADTPVIVGAEIIDWTTGQSISYQPVQNDRWMVLGTGVFSIPSSRGTHQGFLRLVTNDVSERSHFARDRYAHHRPSFGRLFCDEYTAALPALQTHRLQCQKDAGNTASLIRFGLVAIKLVTEDYMVASAAEVNTTSGSFQDGVSIAATFPAGNYMIFAACDHGAADATGIVVGLSTPSGMRCEQEMARHGGVDFWGPWMAQTTVALSGAQTVKIQYKSPAAHSVKIRNQYLVILALSEIEHFASDEVLTETALAAQETYVTRSTLTNALEVGWNHLIVAGLNGYLNSIAGTHGVKARMLRNGTAYLEEAIHGTGSAAKYASASMFFMDVALPTLETDTFKLEYEGYSADPVKVKNAGIYALALKPA